MCRWRAGRQWAPVPYALPGDVPGNGARSGRWVAEMIVQLRNPFAALIPTA